MGENLNNYAALPEADEGEDSGEDNIGSEEKCNLDENASNIESVESESDGEIEEEGSVSNNDNEILPFIWKHIESFLCIYLENCRL